MADNKMEKSIKEAIGKSLNEFNKRIGMAKLIKDNKNQDRILKGILSQVNDENIEKTEKSNVITLDNSTDGIVELQEIKGDTNVNVSKIEKETPITHVIDDKNGNVISLDGIAEGAISIDDIEGNTMVNCCKDGSKEVILNGDIDTSGYSNVTITEGIDGGKVDISLEGNTMVNVCDQEEPVAITKTYTVETGNHIALQGEYDGKCRPNIYGNTLVNLIDLKTPTLEKPTESTNIYNITTRNGYIKVTTNSAIKESWLYVRFPGLKSSMFKPSTTYTVCFSKLKGVVYLNLVNGNGTNNLIAENIITTDDKLIYTFTTKTTLNISSQVLYFGISQSKPLDIEIENPIILEGDYTNKPIPDYFTGMKSSFEDKLVPENLASDVLYNGQINKQYTNLSRVSSSKLKRNTKYTTFIKNDSEESITIYSDNSGGNFRYNQITIPAKSSKVTTIITKDEELSTTKNTWLSLDSNETLPQNISAYLVEGDYTNYDFTDYDSTKGGKYKVDYKVTGKNKCPIENKTITIKGNTTQIGSNEGSVLYKNIDISNLNGQYYFSGEYTINNTTYNTCLLLSKKPLTKSVHNECYLEATRDGGTEVHVGIVDLTNYKYATITTGNSVTDLTVNTNYQCTLKDIQLEEGTTATTYEPYKEYIKTLYLNSPLLEGDTIEQSGNNIIHNHRYKEVVLDGSETTWIDSERELDNTVLYAIALDDVKEVSSTGEVSTLLCDKFTTIPSSSSAGTWGVDKEGISVNTTKAVHIRIAKSKLSEVSLNGFKRWLDANPVKIIYPLKSSNYEIISTNDNLLLDSYTKGHLDVDSVIPIDKVVFKSWGINLKYLYPSIEYTIQFESDNAGILYGLNLNNNNSITNLNIVKGINKFTISTSDTITASYLWTNGIGFNASKIVVTPKVDNNFGYFKGMKSVGECEGNKIEILSNNGNLWNGEFEIGSLDVDNGVENANGINRKRTPYIEIIPNKQYSFKINDFVQISGNDNYNINIHFYDSNKQAILNNQGKANYYYITNGDTFTFTTPTNAKYIRMRTENNRTLTPFSLTLTYGTTVIATQGKSNKKEILLSEPLRGLPNGVKDKYVIIDGKWYIERNCKEIIIDGSINWNKVNNSSKVLTTIFYTRDIVGVSLDPSNKKNATPVLSLQFPYSNDNMDLSKYDIEGIYTAFDGNLCISIAKAKLSSNDSHGLKSWLQQNPTTVIYQLKTPTYEPIDYNPFEVYTDTTHISNNSTIPANMVIKNSGYNCILKPNTTYTVSSNNGLSTVSTKDSIGDSILRFYNKDTSEITKMNKVLVLEGDYITGNPPIPAFFKGMESAFEQELVTDEKGEHYGKYKVNVKATNPDNSQENNITFYIKEPLRGVGDIKDKVYVKEDKVVVERNCGSVVVDGNLSISVPNKDTTPNWYNLSAGGLKVNILTFSIPKPSDCANTWGSGTNNNRAISDKFIIYPSIDSSAFYDGEKIVFDSSDIKIGINKTKLTSQDIDGFRQWLQNNPTTIVYQLATPVYEEVEYPNNRLTLNTYNNSTLFYNSNIPISNTSFKPLWEELVYIKNSTTYYIQFNAVGNGNVVVNLGGTELTTAITEGYNKIEITTPNNSTNLLTIDGQGIKISKVVVSEALCSGYYKGLQSCFEEHMENGKYVCVIRGISLDGNKVNGIKFYLNEPLRGIGDIKDRLCIKDGKLMVERNYGSVIFDGSDDENWSSTGFGGHATRNTFEIALSNINGYIRLTPSISNSFNNELIEGLPLTDNAFRVVTEVAGNSYFLFTPSTNMIPYRDTNKWKEYLQNNPITVVYQLATPTYEEVTNEYGLPIILEGYENGIVYVDSSVTPTTSIKYTSNNKVPGTLSNVDNLNTATQNDINNNIVTYMMDIDMMLTEMEMDDSASTMSLSDFDDNNQNHDSSHSNILDRMNKEDRIKYQDNTTKMLEKVIKGKSLTKEENINRIDLYLSEGKIRKEQSNYLKELLKGVE